MKFKNSKGITLVALVITIILLLLLAAITISSLRNSGLFSGAKNAKLKTEIAQEKEELKLAFNEILTKNISESGYYFINYEELESELKNTEKHPNIKSVEIADAKPYTSIELSSNKRMNLSNLFMPVSSAAIQAVKIESKYAKVTFNSDRSYYIGIQENVGKIFIEKDYAIVENNSDNSDDEETKTQLSEIEELKLAIKNSKEMNVYFEKEIIVPDSIEAELNDKSLHPNITNVEILSEESMPYDTIEVASTNKTIFNLKNLFIPTAQAVGVHYSDHHIRVTFKSLNVYYVSIEDGDKTIENNGKIYASSENFSDFSVIKTNEYLKQLDKSNNLDNFEMYSYLSKLDNLDGYVICGLNSKGQQKLENNELTELKINEKINGKNVDAISAIYSFGINGQMDFSGITKVIIPDSVKVIGPNAFTSFDENTKIIYNEKIDRYISLKAFYNYYDVEFRDFSTSIQGTKNYVDMLNQKIKNGKSLNEVEQENHKIYQSLLDFVGEKEYFNCCVISGISFLGNTKISENKLEELVIPEKYLGKQVVSIEGFFDNIDFSSVKKIIIPSSVKIIQPYAFRAFSPDTEFVHEGGYDFVGEGAFPTAK